MFLELVHISVRGEQKDLVKKKSHFRFDCSSADHQLPIIRPICFLCSLCKEFQSWCFKGNDLCHSFWWRTNTRNISFETLSSGQFTLSTQLINYPVILSHRCSTTVCLETYPLYSVYFLLQSFLQNSFTKRITYNYLISLCLLAKGVGGLGEVNYTWCFTENWNRLQLFPASLI